ncbi:ankyrin repeat and zinc finger domain-containing protein 1 isoform X2 [Xenopus laevis]|nr:ankyrin repeat and zinc finger domain-containing protein 1 isoform X2 [Xenopus laevis]
MQTYSLFEILRESPLLDGISINGSNVREEVTKEPCIKDSGTIPVEDKAAKVLEVSDRMYCSFCQYSFDSREEQKEHYTLDWHRFNLTRRIKGATALSEEDFQEKTQAGDISSISGSDSDSSDNGDCLEPIRRSVPLSSQPSRSQRILFQNKVGQILSVLRCVLGQTKDMEVKSEHLLNCIESLQEQPMIVILMAGGGHFAGAVYKGKEVLTHKTFHRYTVRAKRGTSQAVHDSQNRGHMAKSAGAALRRYNQAALITDISQLLQTWTEHIREARGIYVRAPCSDRALFLGRNSPILRKDPRVHGIPFATRRATFKEVQRVHMQLFSLQVYEKDADMLRLIGTRVNKPVKPKKTVQTEAPREPAEAPNVSEEEEEAIELLAEELTLSTLDLRECEVQPKRRKKKKKKNGKETQIESNNDLARSKTISDCEPLGEDPQEWEEDDDQADEELKKVNVKDEAVSLAEGDELCRARNSLFTCCKTGDLETATQILQNCLNCVQQMPLVGSPAEHELVNERLPIGDHTLLHIAASAGHGDVACLLMDAGWDPGLRDSVGQTPYSVSADKRTRNRFRQYREENPQRFNYSKSQIPGPVSEEVEVRRAEKKRAQKAKRKQREKQEKEEKLQREEEEAEKRRFAALSDREKRAAAAEKRLAAQLNHTKGVQSNIRRCWQCGESLLGKVPFEYLDFSFCTTRCLQEHRRNCAAKS